jgi:thiamine biosynthesis lipoprotein ApbE
MPSDRYASVSIHTESSAVADALSTAVFNMTEDEINALVQRIPDVEITVIDTAGNMTVYGARK